MFLGSDDGDSSDVISDVGDSISRSDSERDTNHDDEQFYRRSPNAWNKDKLSQAIKEKKVKYFLTEDIYNLFNSMKIDDAIDMVTSADKLLEQYRKWKESLEKNNVNQIDAVVGVSYAAIVIIPEVSEGMCAIAFALPGLAIGFAVIASAVGLVYMVNECMEQDLQKVIEKTIDEGKEIDKEDFFKELDNRTKEVSLGNVAKLVSEEDRDTLKNLTLGGEVDKKKEVPQKREDSNDHTF